MYRQAILARFLRQFCLWSLLASLVIAGCAPIASAVTSPCLSPPEQTQELILVAEATRQLQKYLDEPGMIALAQAREEGGFMLGAYPRPQVFWTVRITKPSLTEDDPRLKDIALAAYCLRPGGVWLTITTPAGQTRLVSYAPTDLKALLLGARP